MAGIGDAPYRRIVDDLRRGIESGEIRHGEQLPTLSEITREYGVSKATAQKAMRAAAEQGLATGRAGVGMYAVAWRPIVRRMPSRFAGAIAGEAAVQDADTDGRERTVSAAVALVDADDGIAGRLDLARDNRTCVRRARVIAVDGRTVQLATSWYPGWVAAGTAIEGRDTGPGGAPRRLVELGHTPTTAVERWSVRLPRPDEVEVLGLGDGARVSEGHRVIRDQDGRPIEYTLMICDVSAYVWESTFTL